MIDWHDISGRPIARKAAFGLLGIVNATPDSFYDGGQWTQPRAAAAHAAGLLAEGADIIDIGAESTRPGAAAVNAEAEWQRLAPVLAAIRQMLPDTPVSVDTRKAFVAERALRAGANIVNDVSGLAFDPAMLEVLANYRPGYVLTHSRGEPSTMQNAPRYADVVDDVKGFFERALNILAAAGLPENRIVLDPGIGFGKTFAHNAELMRRIGEFAVFGRPLLAGVSMKSFFGHFDLPADNRREATAIASALLFAKGAVWHRVHHAASARLALAIAAAISPAPDA